VSSVSRLIATSSRCSSASQQYAKTLQQNRSRIVRPGRSTRRAAVAKRIEAVAGRDKPAFDWQVTLIRKNVANAYCFPGGKIVVYTGILPLTSERRRARDGARPRGLTRDGRARAEEIERAALDQVAAAIIAGGVAFTPAQFVRVTALISLGAKLPFSRSEESEADHIGLIYMARAGYDPRQAVSSGSACSERRKGSEPPSSLSDHPSDAHRVERIERWLPEAERAYKHAELRAYPPGGAGCVTGLDLPGVELVLSSAG
jgi:predicted Zn-dependent protease